ncbi:hypothetical protein AC578_7615 [Pseudocercospora eumusae]|uniref:Uncharacterized protein n=1 Tax=Pseudocercospora eumusae TaxID=321146 RepID=A0A139GX24_9PEZI|nr:hypothetical protein AC578_7615 [Pseudocercospora eumusae]
MRHYIDTSVNTCRKRRYLIRENAAFRLGSSLVASRDDNDSASAWRLNYRLHHYSTTAFYCTASGSIREEAGFAMLSEAFQHLSSDYTAG